VQSHLRAGIDQHEPVLRDPVAIVPVVQDACVRARADDRAEARTRGSASSEGRLERGLYLPLPRARSDGGGTRTMADEGQRARAAYPHHLVGVLAQAELVEDATRIEHPPRPGPGALAAAAGFHERPAYQPLHPLVGPGSEMDAGAALQERRQALLDLCARVASGRSEALERGVDAEARPGPELDVRIAGWHEEYPLGGIASDEHREGTRLDRSGRVEQLAVRPVRQVGVARRVPHGGGGQDHDVVAEGPADGGAAGAGALRGQLGNGWRVHAAKVAPGARRMHPGRGGGCAPDAECTPGVENEPRA